MLSIYTHHSVIRGFDIDTVHDISLPQSRSQRFSCSCGGGGFATLCRDLARDRSVFNPVLDTLACTYMYIHSNVGAGGLGQPVGDILVLPTSEARVGRKRLSYLTAQIWSGCSGLVWFGRK